MSMTLGVGVLFVNNALTCRKLGYLLLFWSHLSLSITFLRFINAVNDIQLFGFKLICLIQDA